MREKHDAIIALIRAFSEDRLNDEYFAMCSRLAAVLARKRPSPLVNGAAAAWASGIVRTIGWVNFLDDKTQTPHVKMTDVDKAFGISSGTGQAKSKTIRDMLKIGTFDPEWTLPTKMEQNPLVWMIQVNGFLLDVRFAPTEIQEEAVRRGLVPPLPHSNPGEQMGLATDGAQISTD
jgi:hypothetical protein